MSDWLGRISKARSRQGLYKFLEKQFEKFEPKSDVLTVGAGGKISELLFDFSKKNDFTITTFDISDHREPDILGDFCTYDFGETKFDFVVLAEVLQFFTNPKDGIKNAFSVLKPGGKVIITTPFIFPIHDRPYDLYRFTKHGLEYLLSEFDNVEIQEKNSAVESIDVLWMRFNKIQGPRTFILKHILLFSVYYLKRPITKLLMKYIKTDIMTTGYNVTATKPD